MLDHRERPGYPHRGGSFQHNSVPICQVHRKSSRRRGVEGVGDVERGDACIFQANISEIVQDGHEEDVAVEGDVERREISRRGVAAIIGPQRAVRLRTATTKRKRLTCMKIFISVAQKPRDGSLYSVEGIGLLRQCTAPPSLRCNVIFEVRHLRW